MKKAVATTFIALAICMVSSAARAETALPSVLTPWTMFMQADVVVRTVMVGLMFASLVTWTIWLSKTIELIAARRKMLQTLQMLDATSSIAAVAPASPIVLTMVDSVRAELARRVAASSDDGVKERIDTRLERLELLSSRRIGVGMGVLATIGSTSPFVGLFGTVWGIMNSFIGISKSQTTNLAVVAPGIAEALLATALGLVAAIPAVVIYNHFARQTAAFRALVGDASAAIRVLVSRHLEGQDETSDGILRAVE